MKRSAMYTIRVVLGDLPKREPDREYSLFQRLVRKLTRVGVRGPEARRLADEARVRLVGAPEDPLALKGAIVDLEEAMKERDTWKRIVAAKRITHHEGQDRGRSSAR